MKRQMKLGELLPPEGIDALMMALNADYATESDFHKGIVAVLLQHKESLLEKGVEHEYLAYALEAQLFSQARKAKEPENKVGMRVRVHDGSGEKLLGDGIYEGEVDTPLGKSPKIRLDNGEVVYGYQCWWSPIK